MEDRKKLMAIINPFSGNSKKEKVPQLIDEIIDHSRFDVETALVTRDLRVCDLAARAVQEGYYGVIAVGGDGTVNGAATALKDSDVALAIIPCGSGNGLARHLEIPMNMRRAIEVINRDHVEVCDYCTLNDDTFVCTAGMGFDADIADRYAQRTKRGALNYVKTAFQVYAHYKPIHCTIDIDGEVIDEDVFVRQCLAIWQQCVHRSPRQLAGRTARCHNHQAFQPSRESYRGRQSLYQDGRQEPPCRHLSCPPGEDSRVIATRLPHRRRTHVDD